MTNSKTIISYNGGSAGDLFTLSFNMQELSELTKLRVVQPATLKGYELLVQRGITASLDEELEKIPYQYASTHLLDEVANRGFNVYNIIIDDPAVQLYTIYRQMHLQKLAIVVNEEHIWFNTVRDFCLNKDYQSAAKYWFDNAKKIWLDKMKYRINFQNAKQINFNKLFTDEFVDDLASQGYTSALLKKNHSKWLTENQVFSYDNTISVMSSKLETMDWNKKEGWIEYSPN